MAITRIDWPKAAMLLAALVLGGGGGAFLYFGGGSSTGAASQGQLGYPPAAPPGGGGGSVGGGGGGDAAELARLRSELAAAHATIKATAGTAAASLPAEKTMTPPEPPPPAPPPPCVTSYSEALAESYLPGAKNGIFLRHLYIKTNILPRQARDKHRETQTVAFFLGCADGGTACETQGSLELAKNACSDHPGCNGIYFAALTYASSCFWFGLQMLYIYIYICSHSSTHTCCADFATRVHSLFYGFKSKNFTQQSF